MRIALLSLGCKVNQAEISRMESSLRSSGHEVVALEESPDYCIINTCTVTGKADYQSRQIIRRAYRAGAKIIATGCFAELNKAEVSGMEGVERVIANLDKFQLITQFATNPNDITLSYHTGRARYVLKVQDGCNNACSYCLIPGARGRSRSVPKVEVVREARLAMEAGYREIVLTGVHLGQYGLEWNLSLSNLIEELLRNTEGVRIRLSSLEVSEIDDRLLDVLSDPRICRHLHIPIQGGDDAILRLMNRRYDTAAFASLINKVAVRLGSIALGTDIIAGFPGEDDTMFQNTLNLLNDLPFTYLHVFPFSARPGTSAHAMQDSVGAGLRKSRTSALRRLSDAKKQTYMQAQIGEILEVLAETDTGSSAVSGTSCNYLKVRLHGDSLVRGSIVRVRIQGLDGGFLYGNMVTGQ